ATGAATAATPAGSPGSLLSIPDGAGGAATQPFGSPINASLPKPATTSEPWSPGPGQLQGSDTSEWQSEAEFHSAIENDQFAVIKASQGTGFTDSTFKGRWDELG